MPSRIQDKLTELRLRLSQVASGQSTRLAEKRALRAKERCEEALNGEQASIELRARNSVRERPQSLMAALFRHASFSSKESSLSPTLNRSQKSATDSADKRRTVRVEPKGVTPLTAAVRKREQDGQLERLQMELERVLSAPTEVRVVGGYAPNKVLGAGTPEANSRTQNAIVTQLQAQRTHNEELESLARRTAVALEEAHLREKLFVPPQ